MEPSITRCGKGVPVFTSIDDGISALNAAEQRVAAHDFSGALRLLACHWPVLATTRGAKLRSLITSIPEQQWENDAAILAAMAASYGSATVSAPGSSASGPWFDNAERVARASAPAQVPDILLHHASALRSLGHLDDAQSKVSSANIILAGEFDAAPTVRIALRARSAAQLGMIQLHRGAFDDAERELTLATTIESELSASERVEGLSGLALANCFLGNFARADASIVLAQDAAAGTSLLQSSFGAAATVAEAIVAVRRLRMADATAAIPALLSASQFKEWQPLGQYALALIDFVDGRHIEGLETSRRAVETLRGWQGITVSRALCSGLRTRFLTHLGELDAAASSAALMEAGGSHENCQARYRAGILLRQADPQGCLDELEPCEVLAENHPWGTLIEILLLTAAARYELGKVQQGEVAFDRALYLSATTGIRSPFVALPRSMLRRMLSRASDRTQPAVVHAILDDLRTRSGVFRQHDRAHLSDRELMITRLLSRNMTVSQIAAELFISVNTVKTHTRSIYRKLDASSRKEAIQRVHDLGLDLEITSG